MLPSGGRPQRSRAHPSSNHPLNPDTRAPHGTLKRKREGREERGDQRTRRRTELRLTEAEKDADEEEEDDEPRDEEELLADTRSIHSRSPSTYAPSPVGSIASRRRGETSPVRGVGSKRRVGEGINVRVSMGASS